MRASGLEQCWAFVNCQLKPTEAARARPGQTRKLAVTICHEAGSGGLLVAEKLAARLDSLARAENCHWTVFDQNLVEKVLEDHNLPKKLAQFMPEDRVSQIEDMVQELLGLHPPSWTLVRQVTETVMKLAELGNVILVGRGANVITARMAHVFHVRLIGSLARRVARVREHLQLDENPALEFVEAEDRGRERYLRTHFRAAIGNPLLYHLVINTDRLPPEQAADLIAQAALAPASA